jgi:hypothetical protein
MSLAFQKNVGWANVFPLVPKLRFTAIKLSVARSAKPQLGVCQPLAKLGLGAPSMSVFAFKGSFGFLNLMAVKLRLGTRPTKLRFASWIGMLELPRLGSQAGAWEPAKKTDTVTRTKRSVVREWVPQNSRIPLRYMRATPWETGALGASFGAWGAVLASAGASARSQLAALAPTGLSVGERAQPFCRRAQALGQVAQALGRGAQEVGWANVFLFAHRFVREVPRGQTPVLSGAEGIEPFAHPTLEAGR